MITPARATGGMPALIRFGLPAGLTSFAIALLANLAILILQPSQLCRLGPGIIPLFLFASWVVFVLLAAVAGFLTGRVTGAVSSAALTGIVIAGISGIGLLVLIPLSPQVSQRVAELNAICSPQGSPPIASPAGFSTGPSSTVLFAIARIVNLCIGTAIAAAFATLGGLVGAATRPAVD